MNNAFRKEPDAEKPHVRNSVRDTFGNGCIYSTTYAVQCMLDGTAIDTDWCKGFSDGADKITPLNEKVVAEGTDEKVKEVEDALADGSLHVFDTSTFTVDGKELTTYKKDGSDTEYVSDGYFHESEYGSAPAFDVAIDGITSITE